MPAPDLAQREHALDTSHSVIVQAPAGSGKTELLTQRFLRLLAGVERPEAVLAVTFTRKATQEMRERILGRLEAAARGDEPSAEHERAGHRAALRVLQRDARLGWRLLDHPGKLQIHTIDGLCARIANRFPRLADGLAPRQVVEDPRPLYRQAAQRVIEDLAGESADSGQVAAFRKLLRRLDGNTADLAQLLAEMLAWRDQWLDHLGTESHDQDPVLMNRQRMELQRLDEALGSQHLASALACLGSLALLADDRREGERAAAAVAAWGDAEGELSGRVLALHEALGLLATQAGTPFRQASRIRGILQGEAPERQRFVDTLSAVLETWNQEPAAVSAFSRFLKAPPVEDPDAAAMLRPFHALLQFAAAQLRVLFTETGQADFQHVASQALRALGEEWSPGDALLAEDSSIQHILMDEFQDTSLLQYHLVERLVSGWQQGDGRTLFLVGDPMQSIYRFRKADVGLFRRVHERGRLGPVPLEPVRLEANFRSRQELVALVNRQFPAIFGAAPPDSMGTVAYAPVRAAQPGGGCVDVLAVAPGEGPEGEVQRLSQRIGERLRRDADVSIAVLARQRRDLVATARALHRAGIPFEGVDLEPLAELPVAGDLLAIARALSHPADRLAWLAMLRAPWCGLEPAELHTVVGDDGNADLLERMESPDVLNELDPGARARLARTAGVMRDALEARARVPLHRLTEVCWNRLHGPCACENVQDLDNAKSLLDLLAEVETESPHRWQEELELRIERRYARSRAARVQLMTIHKAKGLEFDVVFLPSLQATTPGGAGRRLLRLQEFSEQDGGEGVLLAPLTMRDAEAGGLYAYLGVLDQEQESNEACRLLYVAMTRARRELVLSGTWSWQGSKGKHQPGCPPRSFMRALWNLFAEAIPESATEEEYDQASAAVPELPQLFIDQEPDLAVAPLPSPSGAGMEPPRLADCDRLALGEALHLWLQHLHDDWARLAAAGDMRAWLDTATRSLESSLLASGAHAASLPELTSELRALLDRVLETACEVLTPAGKAGSWAELAFCSRHGNQLLHHVIDRLSLGADGHYSIVDYKTGEDTEANRASWRAQLDTYRRLVEAATGGAPVNAMVYRPGDAAPFEP